MWGLARRALLPSAFAAAAAAAACQREDDAACTQPGAEDASLLQLRHGQAPCFAGVSPLPASSTGCAEPRVLVMPMPVPFPSFAPQPVEVVVPVVPSAPTTTHAAECDTPPDSCDLPCMHDVDQKGEGSATCRDRVLWARDNSPLVQAKGLQGAIELIKAECKCQCACTEADFDAPVPLPAPAPAPAPAPPPAAPEECETPARSCDKPCMHDVDQKGEGSVTCRDRVLWARYNSPFVQAGDLNGALELIKSECACQCACERADFEEPGVAPVPEPAPAVCETPADSCDSPCVWDVDQKGEGVVTCRDRVRWAKDHSPLVAPGSLDGALALIKKECACQCACTAEDF